MTARGARIVLVLLLLGVTGCDQATKHWAERDLQGKPPTHVMKRVDLEYAQNHGVAFNIERVIPRGAQKPLVLIAGLTLLGALGFALWRRRGELSPQTAGYALVIGGALGNLLDRYTRGYVVDFIHVHGWPVFNVADIAVVAGAGLLIISSRSRPISSPPTPPQAA